MNEEEIRLDQTKRVFDILAELISKNETCTYRYLIYDLLGFDGYYSTLISGLIITNALVEKEDLQQKVEQLEKENRQLCDVRYSLDRVQLEKKIEQLEERSTYLERSNNRREDEIIELRDENVDLVSKNKQLENIRKESIEFIKNNTYYDNMKGHVNSDNLLNILNKVCN